MVVSERLVASEDDPLVFLVKCSCLIKLLCNYGLLKLIYYDMHTHYHCENIYLNPMKLLLTSLLK